MNMLYVPLGLNFYLLIKCAIIFDLGRDRMRAELSDYNNRYIKVVCTFVRFGDKNGSKGKSTVLIRDLINADTGEFLADHMWIEATKEIRNLYLYPDDKIYFVGKVSKYKKGYRGHNLEKVLITSAPYSNYWLTNIQNVIRQKDCERKHEYFKKLKYREEYILSKKGFNLLRRRELKVLIEDTENAKKKFKNNDLIFTSPTHTIETVFSNKFKNIPILYAVVDTFRKCTSSDYSFFEGIKCFGKTYKDIKEYNLYKEEISNINSSIIDNYKELRLVNRRLENIDSLLETLDEYTPSLENYVKMTKNIIWQRTDDDYAYNFHLSKTKTKSK